MSHEVSELPLALHRTPEGTEVVLSDGPSFGVVHVTLLFGLGAEGERHAGETALAFELPEHGTARLDRAALREEIDRLATRIRIDVQKGHVSLRIRALERHLEAALCLASEMMLEARDAREDLSRVLDELDEETDALVESPDGVGTLSLPALLWPGLRWGLPSFGTPAARRCVPRRALHARRMEVLRAPLKAGIAASDPARLLPWVEALVERLRGEAAPVRREGTPEGALSLPATAPEPQWGRALVVPFPRAEQAVVHAAAPAPALGDPQFPAIQLHNMLFAGGFATPLVDRIRSQEGLSYSVGAQVSANHARGMAVFSANPTGIEAVRTLAIAMECWDAFRDAPVGEDALQRARACWLGRRAIALETPASRMEMALHARQHGLSLQDVHTRAERLLGLTPDQVVEAGRRYGWHRGLCIGIVGTLRPGVLREHFPKLDASDTTPEALAGRVS